MCVENQKYGLKIDFQRTDESVLQNLQICTKTKVLIKALYSIGGMTEDLLLIGSSC